MTNYSAMILASLVVAVATALSELQAAMHCLLVKAVMVVAVDSALPNWKYFHWNYSEPRQLLPAINENERNVK